MKTLYFAGFLLALLAACTPKNQYRIEVTVTDGPDSLMVHHNWYTSSDTMVLKEGRCTFTGVIDTFPKLVSIGFPYPSYKSTRMILEPGTITVNYSDSAGFRIGGTENNIILQRLFDELKPYQDKVREVWKAWGAAYKKEPRSKQECEAAWIPYAEARDRNIKKTRELIRENPNYAGLVITLPIARYEDAGHLKSYVDEFKEFTGDKRYESIVKQYEIAEQTTDGKPVPGFTYPDPEGKMVSLSDFKGKWVLLDFWYVDCPWCRKLTPHLINIYNDWNKTKDFEIISISVDKPKNYKRWQEAIVHDGSPWTQVLDSTKTYPLKYGITGYPTLILIDPEGNGVKKLIGYREEGALRRILEKYVGI